MILMEMSKEQFSELEYYLAEGKRPDGSMVTDQWIDQQLRDCLAEIQALGQQLEDLEAITFNTAGLESAAKSVVRSWRKEERSEKDLGPLIGALREALKACSPKALAEARAER